MRRRRRVALVDGGEPPAARSSTGRASAPDERLRRHRARARRKHSLPRAAAEPKTRRDDRPTRQSSTTSQDLRGRRFAPPCAASEAARRRHTSPPTEARADVGARFARGGPFGGPRAAARIHHRLPAARRSSRCACQEDERRGRTACSKRGAGALAWRAAIPAHGSPLGASISTGLQPRVQPRVEPRVEREGEPSSWQARAGAGPWAGPRPPRAKRAPASARASVGGEVWRRRAASEAAQGASVASDRVHPATWCPTVGLACRPPGLGSGSTFRAVSAAPLGRVPCLAGTARAAR